MLTPSTTNRRRLKMLMAVVAAAAAGFLFAHLVFFYAILLLPTAEQGLEISFWGFMALAHAGWHGQLVVRAPKALEESVAG